MNTKNDMPKVMVTGCAGFIGSHLCEKLLSLHYQVVGIDNFDPFYDINIKKRNLQQFIDHPSFEFIEVDVAENESFANSFPDGVDLIVHLAAKAGVRPSIEDPSGYIRANITATQNILDVMKNRGIKKMAFASSSSVYGNTKKTPFSETMDVSFPISPYAATKKACELINYTYHHLYSLDIINMRFFTVFGPRQRPDLAIHKFTKLIRSGQPVTLFGDGYTARDYTYVEDTIAGIVGAITYLINHEGIFETVNLGNNQPIDLKTMVQTIYNATRQNPNLRYQPMQPGDVDITFADITKAHALFGYQPTFDFDEGVKRFVEWFDHNNAIS